MNKIVIISSIAANFLLISIIGYITYQNFLIPIKVNNINFEKNNNLLKKIAIVLPAEHPSMNQIETGFRKAIQENGKYYYNINSFNANGDRRLLLSQIEQIASGNYDLVFTVGATASMLCKEIFEKRRTNCPIVFGAVDDPIQLNIIKSLPKPGKNITGVIEDPAYEMQLMLLKAIKPQVKNIMLLYNPTQGSGLEKHYNAIDKYAKKLEIFVMPVAIYAVSEIYTKLQANISNVDTVLVLKDHTIVSGIDAVIKICNQHHVTLLTTELDSGDKGAALSFGVYEQEFGIQGALLAHKILEEHKNPAELSCVKVETHKFKLNTKTMAMQDLTPSNNFVTFLKHIIVI